MKTIFKATLLFIPFFLASCMSEPTNLLRNGELKDGLTSDWWNSSSIGNGYSHSVDNSIYSSPDYSLQISCYSNSSAFAHWAQTVKENIPVGRKVQLRVKIKPQNVNGNGIAVAIRGDNTEGPSGPAEMFATTQGRLNIGGNSDWKEYEITSDTVGDDINSLTVYFIMMDQTTGTVYFDDAVLEAI